MSESAQTWEGQRMQLNKDNLLGTNPISNTADMKSKGNAEHAKKCNSYRLSL